jgi:transcriptional regulator with XRE-family HTH domain
MKCLNLSGPQIRKLRYRRGWSQSILATKLQLLGWDTDRVGVAKIEAQLVHVDDYELLYFAKAFNVGLSDLFPKIDPSRRIDEVLTELLRRRLPQKGPGKKIPLCSKMGTAARRTSVTLACNVR